jgi:hypothetical protein
VDPSAEAGKGFVYSNGVNGLFFRDVTHTGRILDSASIAPLTANITWNSASIPGLKLNRLSTTNEGGLSGFVNGELWYNTTMNSVRARINGETKTMLKSGDGVGASFQANELLKGVTANDSLTGIAKVLNALGMAATTTGVPTWFHPASGQQAYEEWYGTGVSGRLGWASTTSGTGSVGIDVSKMAGNRPGIIKLESTSSVVPDWATVHLGGTSGNGAIFGGGVFVFEASVFINNAPTAAEDYDFWVGFGDQSGNGAMRDGVYFLIDRGVDASAWGRCTPLARQV